MTPRYPLFVAAALCITQLSCTKHTADEAPTNQLPVATITFSSPAPGTVYANGGEVTIQARVISTANIHGYDLAIRKAGETANIYFNHLHDHNDTVNINEKWTSQVPGGGNMEAEITAYLDHDLNTKKEKVAFRIQ